MKNKAMEIMKQRESMINEANAIIAEARETLVVLGAEEVQETIVTNEIVINKGKIVEVPVVKYETKEVVVDNTDTATIEMLRETIRNMNQTINDMNKEQDELYKLYLEEQREKEIWAAAHADLKEENQRLEEEAMKLEEQNMFLEGKCFGYEQDINRLKAKANRPVIVMEDEKFEDEEQEEEIPEIEQPKEEVKTHKQVDIALHDVRKTHDGVRGRTDRYEFAWAIGKKLPAYKLDGDKAWKPMTGNMYPEARYIMSTLSNFMDQVKKQKETKANKKQQAKTTKPVVDEQEIVLEQPATSRPHLNNAGKVETVKAEDIFGSNPTNDDPWAGVEDYDF